MYCQILEPVYNMWIENMIDCLEKTFLGNTLLDRYKGYKAPQMHHSSLQQMQPVQYSDRMGTNG